MKSKPATQRKTWQRTPTPNLIRYIPSGTYFLRARFGGEPVRESLETESYAVAQVKLADRLRELRSASQRRRTEDAPATLLDAVLRVRGTIERDPSLKDNTRRSYLEEIDSLQPGGNGAVPTVPLRQLSKTEMQEWWTRVSKFYAPQRANHLLMFVRRAMKIADRYGILRREPLEGIRRVKIPRTRLNLLTVEQLKSVVTSIRGQSVAANAEEAANWIEFMAYSGMRPSEIDALEWGDISLKNGVILVWGGKQGTKNRDARPVPIIPAMRELLGRMKPEGKTGAVFRIGKPRDALRNACARLGLPRIRIYDLRHLFATICCSSRVDIPVLAQWLGHKDGGSLAMRTYIHSMPDHARKMAEKVKFA